MSDKSYSTAGMMAILVSVIYALGWVFTLLGEVMSELSEADPPLIIGVADFLFLAFAAFSIYVLLALMRFLHDRHEYHDADPFIWASIGWHAIFFGSSFLMELSLIPNWPEVEIGSMMAMTLFWMLGMVVIGVIDIILAIKLMRADRKFPDLLKLFAYVNLAMGICEASVILAFFTLPLVPVSFILLAILFLRKPREVEFV